MALIITTGKVYLGYVPTGKFLDLRNHVCVRIAVFVGNHFKALGGHSRQLFQTEHCEAELQAMGSLKTSSEDRRDACFYYSYCGGLFTTVR